MVLFNGFEKKDQKTPKGEVEKALKLMYEYFDQKGPIRMKKYENIKSFDQLIEAEHGKLGTESRNQYEEGSQMFISAKC